MPQNTTKSHATIDGDNEANTNLPKKGTKNLTTKQTQTTPKNSKKSHATIDDNDKVNINHTKKGQKIS